MTTSPDTAETALAGPDLSSSYLGLALHNPLVASASPLTRTVDSLLELQQAGVGAVVLPSLFQEEVEAEELESMKLLDVGDAFAEFESAPLSDVDASGLGTERHVTLVEEAKAALSIPVIASVNGTQPGGWARYGAIMAEAGADAIELNLYAVNTDPAEDSNTVESRYLHIIESVKSVIDVPLAVKLSQNFQSLSNFAARATDAGADGLVLFNRFLGPDLDLDNFQVVPRVALSTPGELRLRTRWIAILRSQLPHISLAATGGVHSSADVIKTLLVGADSVYLASTLLQHGPQKITELVEGLQSWMAEREYDSVQQLRGSMSLSSVDNPGEFERAQYVQAITTWSPEN
ncbi:NAD-dependent dihydropyrimidine dehydrogenase subunit PreA [Austwickia sp. TVS 96-490-7B]|uniref:dihydroorotate dehydrogenase-like protein n=1 Tax=Austwickia sp. TVS 96-490-7B TaxID=2830843 RepID=UPI001C582FB7|nr:dihydroorotate dehydrogenase-like protein [Austwickia sp. TVS 96-490-7B]MBW3086322.1 NAD-dependent dihydropyrimidine dehydrogenase subunit PreA [Austwickia sp. TVS 96-490-7B]